MTATTTITSVLGNSQRLDGGAMFGNAPKSMWSRWIPPDEHNRIPLACRAMLVRDQGKLILCETGIGAFFQPELRERYGVVESRHVLLDSLRNLGFTDADIDVVVLSHLHFDHAGGLLSAWEPEREPRLLFPRATYIVGREAFTRAKKPHLRDRASFIPGLCERLEASDRLELVDAWETTPTLGERFCFHTSHGHTPGLLHVEVALPSGPVVYASDLIPGRAWVHLPITMGYDRAPEQLIDEKQKLLSDLVSRNGRLFYTHDTGCAMSRVRQDPAGKFTAWDEMAEVVEVAE